MSRRLRDLAPAVDIRDRHRLRQRNGQILEYMNFRRRCGTARRVFLLRDRDRIFGSDFTQQVKELGIQEVLGAPRAPKQRAYIERVMGTILASVWTM